MATEYDKYKHTHVMVKHPRPCDCLEAWESPMPILLVCGGRVWVSASYCHLSHPEVVQVGDCRTNGYDDDGNCIVSIPAAWCTYYEDKEAERATPIRCV